MSRSQSFRSIVLKVVVATFFAAAIPACSMEAESIKLRVDKISSLNDACQAKETLNE